MNRELLEEKIKYSFNDKTLLEQALTHSSYCKEHGMDHKDSNERLEFLGDAYVDAIVGHVLYNKMAGDDEGRLTKIRADIVCERSLAKIGTGLNLGSFLNMGRGEVSNGGRKRVSIIADAVEAIVGAIFLDGGYDQARHFVERFFEKTIEEGLKGNLFVDYKSRFQEVCQKSGKPISIVYKLVKTKGPEHDKTFYVKLIYNGKPLSEGVGKNKKQAEQMAAKLALSGGLEYVL